MGFEMGGASAVLFDFFEGCLEVVGTEVGLKLKGADFAIEFPVDMPLLE